MASGRFLPVWGPAIALMIVIFAFSSVPNLKTVPGGVSDHFGHFIGYALLSALVLRALASGAWRGVTARAGGWAVAISSAYGLSDEVHQRFVLGRMAALDDWIADTLGAAAGVSLLLVLAAIVRHRRRSPEMRDV